MPSKTQKYFQGYRYKKSIHKTLRDALIIVVRIKYMRVFGHVIIDGS